jgi:hypothetical protein
MQIVDNRAPTQIEEVFTQPAIAGASALPPANMSQCMFNGDPFTEFGPTFWRPLTLS